MATVGSWGNSIVFSTSDYRILTFKDFSRNVSGEWATHGRIGGKDRVEFVKPGLQKISFADCIEPFIANADDSGGPQRRKGHTLLTDQ